MGFLGIRSAGQALDVVATSGQSRAPWYFHLFGGWDPTGLFIGIFLVVQIEILLDGTKTEGLVGLVSKKKSNLQSHGDVHRFRVGAFFGEWIFWESRLRWVHVLVIAKYCNYGFKRSGILHRDRPKKIKSTIFHNVSLDVSKTLLLNLVFLGKNVSNTERQELSGCQTQKAGLHLCQSHDVTWDRSSCDNSINRPENHQNYQPTDPWRMGPFNLLGPFPLTSAPSWEHHLEYDFFKVHFSFNLWFSQHPNVTPSQQKKTSHSTTVRAPEMIVPPRWLLPQRSAVAP